LKKFLLLQEAPELLKRYNCSNTSYNENSFKDYMPEIKKLYKRVSNWHELFWRWIFNSTEKSLKAYDRWADPNTDFPLLPVKVNYHRQRRWLVYISPGRRSLLNPLVKQFSLICFYHFLVLLLPFNIFPYLFLIQSNTAYTIASAQKMPSPKSLPYFLITLKKA
jgi:hypothetical protein